MGPWLRHYSTGNVMSVAHRITTLLKKTQMVFVYTSILWTRARSIFNTQAALAFQKLILQMITYNITFSGASFKSRAQVYDSCHGAGDREKLKDLHTLGRKRCAINDKWKISEEIIEECWFLWTIMK